MNKAERRTKIEDDFKEFLKIIRAAETTCLTQAGLKTIELCEGFEAVAERIRKIVKGNKLIFIGNGGSAAIASHQAVDFFNNLKIRTQTFNDPSLLTCMANDYGYENVFAKPLSVFAEEGDILAAISSSGQSTNILKAVKVGRKKNCFIITMSGFSGLNPLRKIGDINFYVPSFSYRVVEASHSLYLDFILEMLIEKYKK